MNILEQSCKTLRENKVNRVMILCDRDGFANMKEFLFVKLKDCPSYIDSITDKMEDFFVVSDVGDYFISCEDYVFYNIVNIIFCMQQSSTPLSKIPSVFYDVFINENCTKHVEQIREICDIDYQIMEGYLDGHSYEIVDNIDWYDVSEGTVREHLFVGAEIVTNSLLSSQLMRMLHRTLFCYDTNINNAYIKPEDLSGPGSSNYKEWLKQAKEFAPEYNSDLAFFDELILYYMYRVAKGYWTLDEVCHRTFNKFGYLAHLSGESTIGGARDGVGNTQKLVKSAAGVPILYGNAVRCIEIKTKIGIDEPLPHASGVIVMRNLVA